MLSMFWWYLSKKLRRLQGFLALREYTSCQGLLYRSQMNTNGRLQSSQLSGHSRPQAPHCLSVENWSSAPMKYCCKPWLSIDAVSQLLYMKWSVHDRKGLCLCSISVQIVTVSTPVHDQWKHTLGYLPPGTIQLKVSNVYPLPNSQNWNQIWRLQITTKSSYCCVKTAS